MGKGRFFLIAAQLTATVLFTLQFKASPPQPIWPWAVPMLLVALVAANSIWFTRFVSWVIFATAFFAFLVVLSAFTIRFRTETGFNAWPFYRAMVMYIAFIYSSLAQIKLLGGQIQ
jgi:hypothetical protein